jgi:hypothetical protein
MGELTMGNPLALSNENQSAMPVKPLDAAAIETALLGGDLSKLSAAQRMSFYYEVCKSMGLNALSRPFGYISFQGALTFYARKDCAEQLRKLHNITTKILSTKIDSDGICTVHVAASMPNGRTDEDIGALHVGGLKNVELANAKMKCVTKAKRRVTLSICGLGGLPDETEVEDMPGARVIDEVELSEIDVTAQNGFEERVASLLKMIEEAKTDDDLKAVRKLTAQDPAKDEVRERLREMYNAKEAALKAAK